MAKLKPLRVKEHRSFIGPEFGAGPDGPDPQTLNYASVMADPKLAVLARKVFDELRKQFAQPEPHHAGTETPEAEAYRIKLEGWADMLEILLEEVVAELELINVQRRGGSRPVQGLEAL